MCFQGEEHFGDWAATARVLSDPVSVRLSVSLRSGISAYTPKANPCSSTILDDLDRIRKLLDHQPGGLHCGHPDWLFELKYDGFRALAHIDGKRTQLVAAPKQAVKELQRS
jgi:hypothetical protein